MFLNITPTVSYSSTPTQLGTDPSPGTLTPGAPNQPSRAASPGAPSPAAESSAKGASGPQEFSLLFPENPLAEFVELPPEAVRGGLWYSNVLAGVLRGALEMVRPLHSDLAHTDSFQVQIQTECFFVSDVLRGDENTELRVRLQRFLEEEAPPADD